MGASSLDLYPRSDVFFPEAVFRAGSATSVPFAVQAAPGQTANLFEAKNDVAGNMTVISSKGTLASGSFSLAPPADTTATYTAQFLSLGAAKPVVKVMGAASQTANLTEWQDSTGVIVARISSSGGLVTNRGLYSGGADTYAGSQSALAVTALTTGNAVVVVRGLASQTGNLIEWQNSAGIVVASVGNSGSIVGNNIQANIFENLNPAATGTLPFMSLGGAFFTSGGTHSLIGYVPINVGGTIRYLGVYS